MVCFHVADDASRPQFHLQSAKRRTGTAERGADEIVVYSNRPSFGVGPFDHCEGRLRHPAARACAPARVSLLVPGCVPGQQVVSTLFSWPAALG
jgi:hypothetical protein